MQKRRKGNMAELTPSPGPKMWAESSSNRFISEYMDRAYYTAGWDNGVFTDYIKKANTELENAKGLDKDHCARVYAKVNEAVLEGLKEAGKKFKACLVTNTHTTKMPYKGVCILDATNSNYGKLLAKIKSKMDKLDDADWWLSPAEKADKYAIKTTEVAKHIGALGMSHTTFVL